MVLQNRFHQGAVKNRPRCCARGKAGLEQGRQFLGKNVGAASRLPGNGYTLDRACLAGARWFWRLQLTIDEGKTAINAKVRIHKSPRYSGSDENSHLCAGFMDSYNNLRQAR
jgi:hypothetical protein